MIGILFCVQTHCFSFLVVIFCNSRFHETKYPFCIGYYNLKAQSKQSSICQNSNQFASVQTFVAQISDCQDHIKQFNVSFKWKKVYVHTHCKCLLNLSGTGTTIWVTRQQNCGIRMRFQVVELSFSVGGKARTLCLGSLWLFQTLWKKRQAQWGRKSQ